MLKSIKDMRKQNFENKKDLKAIYQHKLDKLRDNLL